MTNMYRGKSKIRTVTINEMDNGYMVNVGCKCFVIEGKERMLTLLTAYINNPYEMEEKFSKNELF